MRCRLGFKALRGLVLAEHLKHAVNQRDPHIELEMKMCIVLVRSYGRFARFADGGEELLG
jgi:hypothetical protein